MTNIKISGAEAQAVVAIAQTIETTFVKISRKRKKTIQEELALRSAILKEIYIFQERINLIFNGELPKAEIESKKKEERV